MHKLLGNKSHWSLCGLYLSKCRWNCSVLCFFSSFLQSFPLNLFYHPPLQTWKECQKLSRTCFTLNNQAIRALEYVFSIANHFSTSSSSFLNQKCIILRVRERVLGQPFCWLRPGWSQAHGYGNLKFGSFAASQGCPLHSSKSYLLPSQKWLQLIPEWLGPALVQASLCKPPKHPIQTQPAFRQMHRTPRAKQQQWPCTAHCLQAESTFECHSPTLAPAVPALLDGSTSPLLVHIFAKDGDGWCSIWSTRQQCKLVALGGTGCSQWHPSMMPGVPALPALA